jgi:uncharacterized protein (TIGR02598 family)
MIKNSTMTVLPKPTRQPSGDQHSGNPHKIPLRHKRGFSLVEVTIALGLVSYALLGLLGLLTVGLTSSRDSSVETALSQIALHASSSYQGTTSPYTLYYTYEGAATNQSGAYFQAEISRMTNATIPNAGTNLHLISISVTRPSNPRVTNTIQASAFVP